MPVSILLVCVSAVVVAAAMFWASFTGNWYLLLQVYLYYLWSLVTIATVVTCAFVIEGVYAWLMRRWPHFAFWFIAGPTMTLTWSVTQAVDMLWQLLILVAVFIFVCICLLADMAFKKKT